MMVMTMVVMVLMMVMTMVILMVMMVNICRDFQGYADKEATKKKVMKDVWRKGDMCFRCRDDRLMMMMIMMMMMMDVMMVVSESVFHFQGLGTSW